MAISAPPASTAPPATRSAEAVTDSELVAAVRHGSDRAFEQLYERYHRRIAAYIYGMVSDYGRAEDISQDVFMSALRRMRGTDRPIAFKPWIYEIAKNACIDQFRRARRGEEISYDAEDGLGAAERGRLVTTAPSPAAQVDQKVAIDNLRGAFGGLSQTHHEILVLREFEGLSYREIGERLGMSRASVESTLFRARRRLTEEYEELVSGERCHRVQTLISTAEGSAFGVRDQRRLSVHLCHCQPCRRRAREAGLDEALFTVPRGVRAKVAAFFPLPAFLQRRWGADQTAPVPSSSSPLTTLAQAMAQYGTNVDPAVASWAKAAIAAAMVAVAGAAGGAAVSDESREYFGGAVPAQRAAAAPRPPVAPKPAQATTRPLDRAGRAALAAIMPSERPAAKGSRGAVRPAPARGGSTPSAAAPAFPRVTLPAPTPTPAPALPTTPAPPAAIMPSAPATVPEAPEVEPEKVVGVLGPARTPSVPTAPDAADAAASAQRAADKATADAAAVATAETKAAADAAAALRRVQGAAAGTTGTTGAGNAAAGAPAGSGPPAPPAAGGG